MFSKTNKTIQPIKLPGAERRNDCQAQYFPNADQPPIKTGHVPMPYHLNFRRPFGCQNLLGTMSTPIPNKTSRKTEVRISNPYLPLPIAKISFCLFYRHWLFRCPWRL